MNQLTDLSFHYTPEPVVEFAEIVYIVFEGEEVIVNVIISPPGDDSLAIETRLISDTAISMYTYIMYRSNCI